MTRYIKNNKVKLILLRGLLGSITIANLAPAVAQTVAPETNGGIGVIVADGGNRVIYTAEYFRRYNVITASDQLDRVPGLQDILNDNGGGDGQRGFGSSGDQVLVNGSRVSGKSNDVESVLDRIQARQVLQIEVIRGAVPGLDVRSQGRVVNVVLEDTLSTGYGSVTVGAEHYSERSPGSEIELNYNGDLGPLSYLFAIEGSVGREAWRAEDRFLSPGNVLLERQIEKSGGREKDLGLTTNTSYSFANGNVLNLNALYNDEDWLGDEISNEFIHVEGSDIFDHGRLNDELASERKWELGGDYQHVFDNGNTLTTLFIYSRSSSEEEGRFSFIPESGAVSLDEVQFEKDLSIEKILRSSYQWSLAGEHMFESGMEVAINTVEEETSLQVNDDGVLMDVPLFNDESTIEEMRYEVFTSYSWQATDRLLLEASLDLEFSELQQHGNDVEHSRDFFYPRPRLALRYDVNEQVQWRGRIERTISQLEFGSFVASFTDDDNRFDVINAGNPELEPEQTWQYEIAYERQLLGDMGVFTITALYEDVSDYIGRIPLQVLTDDGIEIHTAPGNMGDGYSAEVEFSGSLRLDRFSLPGGVLDLGLELQKTEVTDPFTGEKREFNFRSEYEWSLAYRQDLNWKNFSYGVEARLDAPRAYYDLDYWQESEEDIDLDLFVEMQPFEDVTLRLAVDNLLRADNHRERFVYVDNRGNSPLLRRELRSSMPVREISLSVQWVF